MQGHSYIQLFGFTFLSRAADSQGARACAGQEFCVELRKTVPDAVVPVIMISAKTDEENIVRGLQHGCNDFIWCVISTCVQPFCMCCTLHCNARFAFACSTSETDGDHSLLHGVQPLMQIWAQLVV